MTLNKIINGSKSVVNAIDEGKKIDERKMLRTILCAQITICEEIIELKKKDPNNFNDMINNLMKGK